MPLAPKSMPDVEQPSLVSNPAAVREQLHRLLAHPLFANSKRYPALLAYTVEQTLLGNGGDLKERSIGIEVFGRTPTYDANADPVVRITAGEVRKRLGLYYYDSAHAGELIIELPVGSYVPVFRLPEGSAEPPHDAIEPPSLSIPSLPTEPIASSAATEIAPAPKPSRLRWPLLALLTVAGCVIGVLIGMRIQPAAPAEQPTNIDRFWEPFISSPGITTFCLGEPAKNIDMDSIQSFEAPVTTQPQPQQLYVRLHMAGLFALADVTTLTRTAAALQARHKAFRVVPASEATFAQLREGPIVLIGAFDNIWTLRVTQKLRFGFESKNGDALLVDRKSGDKTTWATAWDLPYQKLSKDYAIVARIHDNTTGQPVIIAAGISEEGTEAAGEILYNPVYLNSLLAKAPANWEKMNMEAVIETQVIEGHSGPPNILAVETW
ncbi:hypothetical protein [Occallatibacter savannae]|uniref:hypothetical protein n=1 Tax=Occallatibacter savannae TaxID=1002691 RepID=UPI000D69377A|nr:hypothetical protein [Occallatibacter savannae]